jgi:putative ABC transport system substrate-binding protein
VPIFKEALAGLGRREGTDFVIEARWAGTLRGDGIRKLALELVARKPDVIVTYTRRATQAAAGAGAGIPIVQASGGSLVDIGLAKTLSRPGGFVTGLTNLALELSDKYTELVLDLMPNVQRIGYLNDSTPDPKIRAAYAEAAKRAAVRMKVHPILAEVGNERELESAFATLREGKAQAVIALPASWFEARTFSAIALRSRLPLVGAGPNWADTGALVGYGADRAYAFRRAAWYVDQILLGKKAGDLPIEQPAVFELVLNMRTAKTLGITVPQTVLVRATRVIE